MYNRKVPPKNIVSTPVAASLCELSHEIGRQVGITIDRRGRVKHVIVGDADQLFIPDLGRSRAGEGRFRGIRLIHTHLRDEPLSQDDLTDLVRLRLDLIAAVGVGHDGRPSRFYHSHLLPHGSDKPYAEPMHSTVWEQSIDFLGFIADLEAEFSRRTVGAVETANQTRAIAVHVALPQDDIEPELALRELSQLANTAEVVLVDAIVQRRRSYDPKYVIGRGKLEDLLLRSMQQDCELVVFDQDLTPNQVRAIAEATDLKVIDRSMLIMDIFPVGRIPERVSSPLSLPSLSICYRGSLTRVLRFPGWPVGSAVEGLVRPSLRSIGDEPETESRCYQSFS